MLIIIIAILPLFSLGSTEGEMFKPPAVTMCFALVGSLVISLTVVPAPCAWLVRRKSESERGNPLVRFIQAGYMPLLSLSMRGRWISIAIAAAFIVGAFSVLPKIGTEFLPPLEEGAIAVNVVRLPTASVEGSALQATEIEKRLLAKFPEITTVVSKTGRAEIAEDPMGPEQSDLLIMLRPRKQWPAGMTKQQLVEGINRELMEIPGIRPAFSQPIALRVNELIGGIKSDVAIKIFGEDIDRLRSTAEQIAPVLASIDGASDLKVEQVSGFSRIEIGHDRAAMAQHKINAADINLPVEAALGGRVATTVFEGQRRSSVVVRFPSQHRSDPQAIKRLMVPSPAGYDVPPGQLATVKEVEVPAQISREDSMRRPVVERNVRGRDIGSFVAEARSKLSSIEKDLPVGYRFAWGGQFENQQRATARLKVMVPVAILLIFVLLFMSLSSVKSAVLVMTNLSSAFVGGLMALHLLKINLSASAAFGFIPLFGADVASGLIPVSFFDQLRAQGLGAREAIFQACRCASAR